MESTDTVVNKDQIRESCIDLVEKGKAIIEAGEFEKGIQLISTSKQVMTDTFGETAIETARFYFELGNYLLLKIENSQEILAPQQD